MADGSHVNDSIGDLWRVIEWMGLVGGSLIATVFGYARFGFSGMHKRIDDQTEKASDAALAAERRYATQDDVEHLGVRLERHLDQRLDEQRQWISEALQRRGGGDD